MPIKPENRHRYPRNWREIRAQILDRAGHCCDGSPAYPDCRAANAEPHPVTGSLVVVTIAYPGTTSRSTASPITCGHGASGATTHTTRRRGRGGEHDERTLDRATGTSPRCSAGAR